ncbi:DNA-processing protein DprA [Heliophilum fasciatum]|uniref:DNA protecting protein DprA n=1 Tax=Heliophilum fasciatum TaxID=35700 RepID=A0A4R2RZE4_9FIRM|nr:DNA-processing protein DprA [Heliophilum fasciatum]MCW2277955.1 DNA processing protein [Heliophilum fasciatum]TCP64475.1 DNA protecting protein DprA [Heliophilum fasciatum]
MQPTTAAERVFWIALASLPMIGARRFYRILDHFGSAKAAWSAPTQAWDGVAGVSLMRWLPTLKERHDDRIEQLREKLYRSSVQALTMIDSSYPEWLRQIPDPPPVLYIRGELRPEDSKAIAVVGTRRPSAYGERVCRTLVKELTLRGCCIVSGLARGIDGIAHQVALENGGRTIAVMASGVDIIYPSEHQRLAEAITRQGALVSEYPPGLPPEPGLFPARNRVIAGLSQGVLVIEAGERSGALITTDQALEQGREVFAVPGPITQKQNAGTNRLIQQGAKLVMNVNDILADEQGCLPFGDTAVSVPPVLSSTEQQVLGCLNWDPQGADEIIRLTGLPERTVATTLTLLELKNMIRTLPGERFVIA